MTCHSICKLNSHKNSMLNIESKVLKNYSSVKNSPETICSYLFLLQCAKYKELLRIVQNQVQVCDKFAI